MSRLPRKAGAALAAAGIEAADAPARARGAERVHAVRVASKRLRSFWRVLEPAIGTRAARRRRRALSRSARFLARARERDALSGLARKLSRSERDLAVPLGAFLKRLPPGPGPRSLERRLVAASAELKESARALAAPARRSRRHDIRAGVKKLKRKLRRARDRARRGGEMTDLHACRKRAKALMYVLDAFGVRRSSAKTLGRAADELGDARDLRTLAARARLRGGELEKKARKLETSALARL